MWTALATGCGGGGELLGSLGLPAPDASGTLSSFDAARQLDVANGDVHLPTGPFGPPSLIAPLSDPNSDDEDPTLTGDLLELYFASDRGGGLDIWVSKRSLASDTWGAPLMVTELSSSMSDVTPAVSLDGLTIWLSSSRTGSMGIRDIWSSTRPSRSAPWTTPASVVELNSPASDVAPAPDERELLMALSSDRPRAQGGHDLYVSTRANTTGVWSTPQPLAELNGSAEDYDPFLADRGLQIFYGSFRTGSGDLFWSARRLVGDAFDPPSPMTELNSTGNDSDPTLSSDLQYIVFASDRSGDMELYEAKRAR